MPLPPTLHWGLCLHRLGGTGGMGGAGLVPVSQHGGPADPPPRAPECPFSGLSLTMATSCPLLTLGLAWKLCQPCLLLSLEPGLTRVPAESPTPQRQHSCSAHPQAPRNCPGLPLPRPVPRSDVEGPAWLEETDTPLCPWVGNTMQHKLPLFS